MKSKETIWRLPVGLCLCLVLLTHSSRAAVDYTAGAIAQAEVNPGEEDQINSLMNQEASYEQENMGGGELTSGGNENDQTHSPNGENGFDTVDPELEDENLGGVDQFISNPKILAVQTPDENDPSGYIITLDAHSEVDKLKNFKAISEDMKVFENAFRDCLSNVPSVVWDETEIEKCVGPDFTGIINDISKMPFNGSINVL